MLLFPIHAVWEALQHFACLFGKIGVSQILAHCQYLHSIVHLYLTTLPFICDLVLISNIIEAKLVLFPYLSHGDFHDAFTRCISS